MQTRQRKSGGGGAARACCKQKTHLDAGLHDLRRHVLALDLGRQRQLRLRGRHRGGRAFRGGRKRGALEGLDGRLRLRVARVLEVVDHVLARERRGCFGVLWKEACVSSLWPRGERGCAQDPARDLLACAHALAPKHTPPHRQWSGSATRCCCRCCMPPLARARAAPSRPSAPG